MISIIIATFNCEKLIKATLESISKQSFNDLEIIIVDGNSNDNTIKKVKEFAINSFLDIKIISEDDNGIYDAWNKGLKIASKKWIMFLGAGDELCNDTLNNYTKNFDEKYDILFSKIYISRGGTLKKIKSKKPKLKSYMNIPHPSILHNISMFNELGFYDIKYKIAGDYEFLLRKKLKYKFCNFYSIIMEGGGVSVTNKIVFKETLNAQNKYFPNRILINYFNYWISLIKFNLKKNLK